MYKSIDAGRTWTNVGLSDTRHIAKIRIHPSDPNLVYVAALGHTWGPNSQRGVYRSKDGGDTWEQVLFNTPEAGAIDLTVDPANPSHLFASLYQLRGMPWTHRSGGPHSGLYRSTDGGDTWTDISRNPGLPQVCWERLESPYRLPCQTGYGPSLKLRTVASIAPTTPEILGRSLPASPTSGGARPTTSTSSPTPKPGHLLRPIRRVLEVHQRRPHLRRSTHAPR